VDAVLVVAEIYIRYRKPVKIGVILNIQTQVNRRSKHSYWVDQIACRNGSKEIVAEASVTNVFIHDDGRTKRITSDILDIWPDLADADGE
jgi:acyl-CoA thioesterase FadM